jgi:hypothetical protein
MKKWILILTLAISLSVEAQKAITCFTAKSFTSITSKEGDKKSTIVKYAKPMTLCKYGDEQISFYVPIKGEFLRILDVEWVGIDTFSGRYCSNFVDYPRTIMIQMYHDEIVIQFMKGDGRMISMKNIKSMVMPTEEYLDRKKNLKDW